MFSKLTSAFLITVLITQTSWAQDLVNNLEDAENVMVQLAKDIGSENDANAVFVSSSQEAKMILIEILRGQKSFRDIKAVEKADYVGVIVENNDEEVIHYFIINKGQIKPQPVGDTMEVTSVEYFVCPAFRPNDLPTKFAQVKNLLLGMDPQQSVVGTVWFEDIQCQER